MRDGHAASLGWVLELNMAALLGDLYPTVRFQGFDDVLRLHVCTNTHNIGIFVKCIDTHASIVSSRRGRRAVFHGAAISKRSVSLVSAAIGEADFTRGIAAWNGGFRLRVRFPYRLSRMRVVDNGHRVSGP